MLDRFDMAILNRLQESCRTAFAEIGERVGLSASACHKRVKTMEQTGLIAGYVAIVSEERAQLRTNVFVQVTLSSQKEETLSQFEAAIRRHDEIMEC